MFVHLFIHRPGMEGLLCARPRIKGKGNSEILLRAQLLLLAPCWRVSPAAWEGRAEGREAAHCPWPGLATWGPSVTPLRESASLASDLRPQPWQCRFQTPSGRCSLENLGASPRGWQGRVNHYPTWLYRNEGLETLCTHPRLVNGRAGIHSPRPLSSLPSCLETARVLNMPECLI